MPSRGAREVNIADGPKLELEETQNMLLVVVRHVA